MARKMKDSQESDFNVTFHVTEFLTMFLFCNVDGCHTTCYSQETSVTTPIYHIDTLLCINDVTSVWSLGKTQHLPGGTIESNLFLKLEEISVSFSSRWMTAPSSQFTALD